MKCFIYKERNVIWLISCFYFHLFLGSVIVFPLPRLPLTWVVFMNDALGRNRGPAPHLHPEYCGASAIFCFYLVGDIFFESRSC